MQRLATLTATALRGELVAERSVRQTVGLGLAGAAVVILVQAQAIFGTPAAWLLGAAMALIGFALLLSSRTAAPRTA